MNGARSCELPGCGATIQRGKLMCMDHWFMVPAPLRRAVTQTWRSYLDGPTLPALSAYRQAVREAVEAVQERLP